MIDLDLSAKTVRVLIWAVWAVVLVLTFWVLWERSGEDDFWNWPPR